MARRKKNAPAARIGARESAARRCPECNATPVRQVGDPRSDERGWEYRKRACDVCGWTGTELRAIIDEAFAVVLSEVIAQAEAAKAEAKANEIKEILES